MDERYVRNLGALTEQECNLLRTKTVFVAGCGGLGGYLIEMLLRLGVGTICAAMQTALCTRILTGRPVETGRLYMADLLDMELESLF